MKYVIQWLVIYPVYSVIQPSNNWDQENKSMDASKLSGQPDWYDL